MLNFNSYQPVLFKGTTINKTTNNELDIEKVKKEIETLQDELKKQMATPPKTRNPLDWGYYDINMNNIQQRIAELRKICPLDKTCLDEVMNASPSEIFDPKKALNIKGQGISFCQNLPDTEQELENITYNAVPIFTNARTIGEMIKIGKRDGIEIEPFKDADGKYHAGIKNIWNEGEYFGIDRQSVAMQYGEYSAEDPYVDKKWAQTHQKDGQIMDCAVVANDNGAKILEHSYIHKGGSKINDFDMSDWDGFKTHKDNEAIINVVAFDSPQKVQTLEGVIESDVVMGDVDGNAYNNFKQLKKQILPDKNGYCKLRANPNDKNSQKFIDLVLSGKDEDAKALLRKATKESLIS